MPLLAATYTILYINNKPKQFLVYYYITLGKDELLYGFSIFMPPCVGKILG